MTKLQEKFEAAAIENGWSFTMDGNRFTAELENPETGYPHRVSGTFDGDSLRDGVIWNDYGMGEEEFIAGKWYLLDALKNVNNPLKYRVFYLRWLDGEPIERSEKVMSKATGVSERQIRKARILGFADHYVLDALCAKLLHINAMFLYGIDDWIAGVEVDFEDDWEAWHEEYLEQQS